MSAEVEERTTGTPQAGLIATGVLTVLALSALTRYFERNVPTWTEGTALEELGAAIEYPVYAIVIGLLANAVLAATGVRDRLAGGFRTEFFIKTGLVLLGASINLAVLVTAAGPAIAQAFLMIVLVFGFTWWLAGKLGLEFKARSLREAGWRPIVVFAAAVVFNLVLGLGLSALLFSGVDLS